MLPENGPAHDGRDEDAPAEEAPAPRSTEVTQSRRGGGHHRNTSIGSLINVLQQAIAAKQKQHEKKNDSS